MCALAYVSMAFGLKCLESLERDGMFWPAESAGVTNEIMLYPISAHSIPVCGIGVCSLAGMRGEV